MKKLIFLLIGFAFVFSFDLTFTRAFQAFNKGISLEKTNPQLAQQYFQKAYVLISDQKDKPSSQIYYMLGRMYCNGWGVKQDLKKAEIYFKKALALGNERVNCCIARLYIKMGEYEKAKPYLKYAMSHPTLKNYCNDIDPNTLKIKEKK